MKKFNFNDYIPEELADNESCRLITEEQYKEWKASEKKLEIAKKALEEYSNCKPTEWMTSYTADKALKEMEEV